MAKWSSPFRSLVTKVERTLRRYPRVYQFASRVLYRVDPSFYTLSPGLPAAVDTAMRELQRNGSLEDADYFEFGVFRGFTLLQAQRAADGLGARNMRFYGFDSFEGLPTPQGDEAEGSMFFAGQFACSLAFVKKALVTGGADLTRISLTKGFFDQALTGELKASLPRRRVGVAVIDCDMYSSTVPVLEWIDDMIAPGSILLMDDWHSFGDDPSKGQQRALGEWLARRPDLSLESMFDFETHGRAFRIIRAAHPNDAS